jgi:aspartate aminotransferase
VIVLAPYWVSYPEMVRMVYGIPVIVRPEDGGFRPRMQEIEEAVSSYTKAIIVNSPNNPSGIMYDESFIADLVDFCERKGIYLIMDDIYHKLVFGGKRWVPAYRLPNGTSRRTRVIVVNGVSKVYGLTGARIGWTIANRRLTEVMNNVQSQITSNPSIVSQAAAEGALTGLQSVVENLRLTIENNRDVLMQEMRGFHDAHVVSPDGTFYALIDFRAYDQDSTRLATFLLEKSAGRHCPRRGVRRRGLPTAELRRLGKELIEGIERMKWALDPQAPNEIYIGDRKMVRDWL